MLLQIYEPPMCCSSGVCGPAVDPRLTQFAADLRWLESQGVKVERYNLAQQPAAFVANATVKQLMTDCGNECLPLLLVDGAIASEGRYPTREELASFVTVTTNSPSLFTPAVSELVAIGAAVAANCEACFERHWQAARELGVSVEDIAQAVAVAETVRLAPARSMRDVVRRHLGDTAQVQQAQPSTASSCCVPELVELGRPNTKCC